MRIEIVTTTKGDFSFYIDEKEMKMTFVPYNYMIKFDNERQMIDYITYVVNYLIVGVHVDVNEFREKQEKLIEGFIDQLKKDVEEVKKTLDTKP